MSCWQGNEIRRIHLREENRITSFLGEHLIQMIICASQNKIKVADWKKKREKEEKKEGQAQNDSK